VKVFISKRATLAAERIRAHWHEHADHRHVFDRELLAAIDQLEREPTPGAPFPTAKRPGLRRILLPTSRCHLYFELDAPTEAIHILQVWDGRRARPPRL